jgi:hypothetical protein
MSRPRLRVRRYRRERQSLYVITLANLGRARTALIVLVRALQGVSPVVFRDPGRPGSRWLCRPQFCGLASERVASRRVPPWRGSKRDRPPDDLLSDMPAAVQSCLVPDERAEGLLNGGGDDRGGPA